MEVALFDSLDAIGKLKSSKAYFLPLARPVIVIVLSTSVASLLDIIELFIR